MGLFTQVASGLAEAGTNVISSVASGIAVTGKAAWDYVVYPVGEALVSHVAVPLAATGINLLGYIVEKALFGPPGLRPYAADGIFPANVDYSTRNKIVLEYGFDPYEHLHPVLDNLFGVIFGAGLGLFQYLNFAYIAIENIFKSFFYNLTASFNLVLGEYGFFGKRHSSNDPRSQSAQILFGILSFPLVAVFALAINALDLSLTFLYHTFVSIIANFTRTFNLILRNNGIFGERKSYDDDRHILLQVLFGMVSAPIVFALAVLTNVFDIGFQLTYHTLASIYYNIRASYNLLGKYGILGDRKGYDDDRKSTAQKIIFGIITAPIVIPISLITNILDAGMSFLYESVRSIYHNLRPTVNLLGTYGVFGESPSYQDSRNVAAKLFFGLVSIPIVLPVALISNLIDAGSSFIINYAKSVGYQIYINYNVLGNYGVLGPRRVNNDSRGSFAQWFYGILALPFTIPFNLIPNVIDFTLTFFKHTWLSFYYNMKYSLSLIKQVKQVKSSEIENAQLDETDKAEQKVVDNDPRHYLVRIFFGIPTFPIVLVSSVVSYTFIGGSHFIHNLLLSIKNNILATYNLLGKEGVFGERQSYNDSRSTSVKILFGAIGFPVVLVASTLTNLADFTLSFGSHFALSVGHNIRVTYNILGDEGFLGDHKEYTDKRHAALRILFGLPSIVLVAPVILITNSVDVVATFAYHTALSFGHNLRATYHLLGQYGVIGSIAPYKDDRDIILRVFFGIVSAPAVFVVSTLLNVTDITLSLLAHTVISFGINIARIFNVILGAHGVFGDRLTVGDPRNVFAQVVYGILSAPFVFSVAVVTNTADLFFTSLYHSALSYARNIRVTFNILGNYGVMGDHRDYDDSRNSVVRILFGLLTLPLVLLTAAVTNTLDAAFTGIYYVGKTLSTPKFWKILGGIIGGSVAAVVALPAFLARRTLKSVYYIFIGGWTDPDLNSRKVTKSLFNIVTLGVSGLAFKYFGISSRFRSAYMKEGSDEIQAGKQAIKTMIYEAKRGELTVGDEVVDKRPEARQVLRFIGLRHTSEKILKQLDDSYRAYVKEENKAVEFSEDRVQKTFKDFFVSRQGKEAIRQVKLDYRDHGVLVDNLAAEIQNKSVVAAG